MVAKELAYYRAHFREAVQKDGVVCLECGRRFKSLAYHVVSKHRLSIQDYKAKWGYNRTTALVAPSTHRKLSRAALAMNLSALSPRGSLEEAVKAKRGRAWPYRPESRLIQTEAARSRLAADFRRAEQRVGATTLKARTRQVARPKDGVELSKEDQKVLSLRNRGLWPSEIAATIGIRVRSVRYRLDRLRTAGFTFSPPTTPRPLPHRKVTNDELLALARSGLSIPEIAARLGMPTANAHRRLKRLTERVELDPIGGVPIDK